MYLNRNVLKMTMKNSFLLLRSLIVNITNKRTLFHESYLGLDRFKSRKYQESQSSVFRKKFEHLSKNPDLNVFGHDFKRFVYLINTEEDFQIFSDLLERYAKTENGSMSDIKFQVFNIGPEIMKVFYTMNKPVEAVNLLKNPNILSLICNLRSLIILQDLLYENGMYQEVCDVFSLVQQKQFYRKIFHFAPYTLCQAACYKMDSSHSYENVIALYESYIKHNNNPTWAALLYTLMFALKNCSLDIPVKYAVGFHPTPVNIKLSALIKSGNYSDALRFCDSLENKSVIIKSVAEDLCKSLKNEDVKDKSLMAKLQKFQEEIGQKQLKEKTLDELAADYISSIKKTKDKGFLDL